MNNGQRRNCMVEEGEDDTLNMTSNTSNNSQSTRQNTTIDSPFKEFRRMNQSEVKQPGITPGSTLSTTAGSYRSQSSHHRYRDVDEPDRVEEADEDEGDEDNYQTRFQRKKNPAVPILRGGGGREGGRSRGRDLLNDPSDDEDEENEAKRREPFTSSALHDTTGSGRKDRHREKEMEEVLDASNNDVHSVHSLALSDN